MRTPLSFDKDTAILLASCCELTYEQYKQMGFLKYQMVFNMYKAFKENHSNDRMVRIHTRI